MIIRNPTSDSAPAAIVRSSELSTVASVGERMRYSVVLGVCLAGYNASRLLTREAAHFDNLVALRLSTVRVDHPDWPWVVGSACGFYPEPPPGRVEVDWYIHDRDEDALRRLWRSRDLRGIGN